MARVASRKDCTGWPLARSTSARAGPAGKPPRRPSLVTVVLLMDVLFTVLLFT